MKNNIYLVGGGHFADEVYSEVFLQGTASHYGLYAGKLHFEDDTLIYTDFEGQSSKFGYEEDAVFICHFILMLLWSAKKSQLFIRLHHS